MPAIAIGLRKNRAEGTAGHSARIAQSRIAAAGEALEVARERIEIVQKNASGQWDKIWYNDSVAYVYGKYVHIGAKPVNALLRRARHAEKWRL